MFFLKVYMEKENEARIIKQCNGSCNLMDLLKILQAGAEQANENDRYFITWECE